MVIHHIQVFQSDLIQENPLDLDILRHKFLFNIADNLFIAFVIAI